MKHGTKIITVPIDRLRKAPWNYKPDDEERAAKLVESITRHGSYGVLAIRDVGRKGNHEVCDGNHRLEALQRIGLKRVRCEDFGKLSKAKAVALSMARNAGRHRSQPQSARPLLAQSS